MRPASIRRFEQFYLGALLLGLINTILSWSTSLAAMQAMDNPNSLGVGFFIAIMVISFAVSLLFWYLIARRGSVVAKWIMVCLFGIGVLSMLWSIASGGFALTVQEIVGIVATALQAYAIAMLFRADAVAWLGKRENVAQRFE